MRIGCISDVCLGYGSPQIAALTESLSEHYGAENLVVEPSLANLPPRHNLFPKLRIKRANNILPPYSDAGRVDYVLEATRVMNAFQPDVLIICCTYSLPVLFKLNRRPRFVIYYSYESIPFYGAFDEELNRHLEGRIDLILFPEENRAVREIQRFGFRGIPKVILYNCSEIPNGEPQYSSARNGRVIYSGTIDREMTLAEYYTKPETQQFPIDLYGNIRAGSEQERQAFLQQLGGQIKYCGVLDRASLARVRKEYAYSIVIWNPNVENQLFAAPNKFFESIADGVPPIAAPHPQCKMLIRRYGCGLLLWDWSFTEFCEALRRAFQIYASARWQDMVSNCARAFTRELNWRSQFEKLVPHLPRGLA